MPSIQMVITNNGDGSNSIRWVTDPAVIDKMQELADDGDGCFASGDGLQVRTLAFPADFDLETFMKVNRIRLTKMSDMEGGNY